jgi:hypothetical protein
MCMSLFVTCLKSGTLDLSQHTFTSCQLLHSNYCLQFGNIAQPQQASSTYGAKTLRLRSVSLG